MSYLRLENITKSFGEFTANDNISLTIEAGSIHAILGENGAGKSTLMNIIGGVVKPSSGKIYLQDRLVNIKSSKAAIELGIGMIHQHFMLVPQLTVTENIILGVRSNHRSSNRNHLRLNLTQKQQEIAALSQAYNLDINPQAKVGNLPIGIQQRVEILKVLYRQANLLILDEPTAVLTPTEVDSLIHILKQLAATGNTIIFISHKLEEVINLCDTVTILRRGKVVANTTTKETTSKQLAELMVGRELSLQLKKPAVSSQEVVLSVQNLQVEDQKGIIAVNNLSFNIKAGEILGVAGVDGNGQRELADAICGLAKIKSGTINPTPQLKQIRIGYIPEDRQKMGLVMQFNVAQNLILKTFYRLPFCRNFLLQKQLINNHANSKLTEYDIRATSPKVKATQLSGGNQQKIVLARELDQEPSLIVAMQPTRGLDIGAIASVQQRLLAQRQRGAAILYISTELEEVIAMSDRIAVMYEGQFLGVMNVDETTIEEIGLLMGGFSIQ